MALTSAAANNRSIAFRRKGEAEMPLKSGTSRKTVSSNISELHTGKTYAHTVAKFGKKKADKQAVAIALQKKRDTKNRAKRAMKRGAISEKAAKRHLGGY